MRRRRRAPPSPRRSASSRAGRPPPAPPAHTPLARRSLPRRSMISNSAVVVPLSSRAAGPRLHRPAAGVGLHAAAPSARALQPVHLHHDVADLGRGTAPRPALAVQHQAAADARAPEDAEHRPVALAGAEPVLGLGRDVDVVADPHRHAEVGRQRRRRAGTSPPSRRCCRSARPSPVAKSIAPGAPTPAAMQLAGRCAGRRQRRRAASRPSRPRRPADRPAAASASRALPRTAFRPSITTAWIFVPPRSMPPRSRARVVSWPNARRFGRSADRAAATAAMAMPDERVDQVRRLEHAGDEHEHEHRRREARPRAATAPGSRRWATSSATVTGSHVTSAISGNG